MPERDFVSYLDASEPTYTGVLPGSPTATALTSRLDEFSDSILRFLIYSMQPYPDRLIATEWKIMPFDAIDQSLLILIVCNTSSQQKPPSAQIYRFSDRLGWPRFRIQMLFVG